MISFRLLDTEKLVVAGVGIERLRHKTLLRDKCGTRGRVPVHVELVHLESACGKAQGANPAPPLQFAITDPNKRTTYPSIVGQIQTSSRQHR
jgi:hypothetical protein